VKASHIAAKLIQCFISHFPGKPG